MPLNTPACFLALVLVTTPCISAWGASPGQPDPLRLHARHVQLDQKTDTVTYVGDVRVWRGQDLAMRAARAVATRHRQTGKFDKVVATGQPVTVRHRPPDLDEDIHLQARQAEYDIPADKVYFSGDVLLRQDGDVIKSDHLHYNLGTGEAVANNSGRGRVYAVLTRRPAKATPQP